MYPHPVLGSGLSYIKPVKEDDIELCVNQDDPVNYRFLVKLNIPSKNINALIGENKVEYMCEIDCPDTFYRVCKPFSTKEFAFDIPRKEVYDEISFSCSVVVKEDFLLEDKYSEWHTDFKGLKFNVSKGEPIAVFPIKKYPVDLRFERLYASGSFIQFDQTDKQYTWINLNEDKIVVMLPKNQYLKFKDLRNNLVYANIFRASIVLNALEYALRHITESQYKNKLWAQAVCQRVQTESKLKLFKNVISSEVDDTEILNLAQALLDDPYGDMIKLLLNKQQSKNNNDGNQ